MLKWLNARADPTSKDKSKKVRYDMAKVPV